MSQQRSSRQIELAARPSGEPVPSDFQLSEVEIGEVPDGHVLVENRFMSVDPYMRGRMNDRESYVPPFALGEPLAGAAVGEVIESSDDSLAVGDLVTHGLGWRELAVVPAGQAQRVPDIADVPLSAHLGVLGMPGLTAYVGLLEVAAFREGDAVFVSGAAGAVGSEVGQLARLRGASRVVGSAGSAEKVAHLVDDLGFDAAFDYHDGRLTEQLRDAAPDGIDVYFDNVGGDHLQAAIDVLNPMGRVALCGAISVYNDTEPAPGPSNLTLAIGKQLTLRGFIVSSFAEHRERFLDEVGGWVADGSLRFEETVVEGIERAPEAFIGLLSGANTGKMVVSLGA